VNQSVRWDDSHCHLDPDTAAERVAEARAAGVDRIVNVGTDVDDSRTAIETAQRLDDVWATAGVHPHEASRGLGGLERFLSEPEVVAVGECGLDYHYDHSPRAVQRQVFAAQIVLAQAHELALVIHTREAWDDTFSILEAEGVPPRTVFHCFSGGPGEAERALGLGALVSFSGIVTFKHAGEVRQAAAATPIDRMLVETDSPYLAPVPHRGRPNRPAWVGEVGRALADIKGVPAERLADAMRANGERVFRFGR
jgi:TatD DNase family protein